MIRNNNNSVHVQTKKSILLNLDKNNVLSLNHVLCAEKPMPLGLLGAMRLMITGEEELAPLTIRNANFGERESNSRESAAR